MALLLFGIGSFYVFLSFCASGVLFNIFFVFVLKQL